MWTQSRKWSWTDAFLFKPNSVNGPWVDTPLNAFKTKWRHQKSLLVFAHLNFIVFCFGIKRVWATCVLCIIMWLKTAEIYAEVWLKHVLVADLIINQDESNRKLYTFFHHVLSSAFSLLAFCWSISDFALISFSWFQY